MRRTALPSVRLVGEQDAGQGRDTAMSEPSTLLGIYLNDHLAGATGGLALFPRATSSAQGASKAELAELTQQVTQDR